MVEFLAAVGFGVIGGLILNVMPCVFPVLFMKVQHWVAGAGMSNKARRVESLGYLLGCLLAFSAFAVLVIALRASGKTLGWGMQMQNPAFVGFLIALLFALALESVGVFTLRVSVHGGRSTSGWVSSMFDGAVITLVSTPCSAPFLGGAAAYALGAETPWWQTLALFWSVGLGLAIPVLLLGFVPRLNKLLPRPGHWMDTFKYLVAFTLFGACVWLFGTLQKQVSATASNDYLWFLLALGAGLWAKENLVPAGSSARRLAAHNVIVSAAVVYAGFVFIDLEKRVAGPVPTPVLTAAASPADGEKARPAVPVSVRDDELVWTPFTADAKKKTLARGQPIFVDFTADWCASCKTFEKTHINVESVRETLAETQVLAMKADLTADEGLWDVLAELGRNGLPTYVIYLPDGSHDLLPEGPPITLVDRLEAAAQKFPPEKMQAM